MSLEAIERYIGEIEALKNYPMVKQQRDQLVNENAELKDRVSGLEKEVNGLRAELGREVEGKKVAGEELKAEKALAEKLDAELGKVSKELGALKEFEFKSTSGRNLTLEQARIEFLKSQESEIKQIVDEKYGALKTNFEARMPELVYEKLIQTIGKPPWPKEIAGAVEANAKEIADGILRDKERWPGWFKEHYLKEVRAGVSAGLDAEFARAVENGASERAEVKLKQLTTVEWPRWLETNVKPKLSDLEAKIKENVIGLLRSPWRIRCDRCGTEQEEIELTEHGISALLSTGYVEKECTNTDCREWDRIRRHEIRISLQDLIAAYIRG
jgi:hypothetical protein